MKRPTKKFTRDLFVLQGKKIAAGRAHESTANTIGISAVSEGPGINSISPENKGFFSDKRF